MERQKIFYIPSGNDVKSAQIVSSWTKREADKGNMVYRTPQQLLDIYTHGDGVIRIAGGADAVLAAHAARTHTYTRRTGPFGFFKQHIHEIGAVATEEGYQKNGFARDVVVEAVRRQLTLGSRLRRREVLKPQIIAMAQTGNLKSNRFFDRLGSRMNPSDVPQEAYQTEAVGLGEHAHEYNTYDVTGLARRKSN